MARKGTLVAMTTAHGSRIGDVRRWPDDATARDALTRYLNRIAADPDAERTAESQLDGYQLEFTGADLSGMDLLGAEFTEATLTGVQFVGADLYTAWIRESQLSGADLSEADLRKVQGQHCNARHSKMCGANLQSADFSNSDLFGADFSGARMERASFDEADLRQAIFRDCVFGSTWFWGARLAGSDVRGATGLVGGPADVGVDSPHLIDGVALQEWFAANGAPDVKVHQKAD